MAKRYTNRRESYMELVKCPCGKEFIPAPAHIYRMYKNKVCEWHCCYSCHKARTQGNKYNRSVGARAEVG